jgi:hypothetical protein
LIVLATSSAAQAGCIGHLEVLYADHDRDELSSEDSAMLSALMDVPRTDQLEFLA